MIVGLKQALYNMARKMNTGQVQTQDSKSNEAELGLLGAYKGQTHKAMYFLPQSISGQAYILTYFLPVYL